MFRTICECLNNLPKPTRFMRYFCIGLVVFTLALLAVTSASAWFKADPPVATTIDNVRGAPLYSVRPDQGGEPIGTLPYGFPVTVYYCLGQDGPVMVALIKVDAVTYYIWSPDTAWGCGWR